MTSAATQGSPERHTDTSEAQDAGIDALTADELRRQLTIAASEVIKLGTRKKEHGKDKYVVSIGNEHFEVHGVDFSNVHDASNHINGYRLWQRRAPRGTNQDYQPIYLVVNGDVANPALTLQPTSGAVTRTGEMDSVTDIKQLVDYAEIINAIGQDTKDTLSERRSERRARRKKARRGIVRTAMLAAVVAAGTRVIPAATDWFSGWRADNAAQQAKSDAAAAAEAASAAAEAREARLDLEADVREFDESITTVDGAEAATEQAVAAEATDQFTDVEVPNYNTDQVSESVAHDIEGTVRAITIPSIAEGWAQASRSIDLGEIRLEDGFTVSHNGESTDLVVTYFNPDTNQLEIINMGSIDGGPSTATQLYIHQTQG